MRTVVLTIALACAIEAAAQTPATIDTDKVCRDARTQPLTEPRIDGPLSGKSLAECNTSGLYYGAFGNEKNLAAALQCGWYQRTHPEAGNKAGDMFHGVGTLTMLYANGLGGAPQDLDLAIRFACEMNDVDTDRRIKHLESLKNANPPKDTFDLCDDAFSRFAGFACGQIAEDLRHGRREKDMEAISAKLTAPQKRLFEKLRAAVPQATPGDAGALDAQLNAEYQRIMRSPSSTFENTTIKPEGIRTAQRAWLPLRDAWVEFAKSAYPKLSTARVTAQIIRLRLDQLRKLP